MNARLFPAALLAAFAAAAHSQPQPTDASPVLFEGARLITGEDREPIAESAFVVENGVFTAVGRKGEVRAPAGARRVDLTGKTVMPGLIELHAHLGYFEDNTEPRARIANFTREQLLKELRQLA